MHTQPSMIVIDDHPMIRMGLIDAMRSRFPDITIQSFGDAESGVEFLTSELSKSTEKRWLVLMDLGLPGLGGTNAIQKILAIHPSTRVITISGNDDELQVSACLQAGAFAFISKSAPFEATVNLLSDAIAGTLTRGYWLSSHGPGNPASLKSVALTDRQMQVLSMICKGMSNREISEKLGIAEITAKSHIGSIFRSLGVGSRTQAVLVAQKLGYFSGRT